MAFHRSFCLLGNDCEALDFVVRKVSVEGNGSHSTTDFLSFCVGDVMRYQLTPIVS